LELSLNSKRLNTVEEDNCTKKKGVRTILFF
jgi:hypothetical protein